MRFGSLAVLVHNVTRPLENITARRIRTVLANNESYERLIIGRRPLFSCHCEDRSRYGYWLRGCLFLLLGSAAQRSRITRFCLLVCRAPALRVLKSRDQPLPVSFDHHHRGDFFQNWNGLSSGTTRTGHVPRSMDKCNIGC